MTAFETAWQLMKAPLDVGSIDYDFKNVEEINPYSTKNPTESKPIAYFDDPKSGERLPIFSTKAGSNQYIQIGDKNNPRSRADIDTGGVIIGERDTHANLHPHVSEEYRQRGYATAMYDLVAHLLQQSDFKGKLYPFHVQSPAAKAMWENLQLGSRMPPHSDLHTDNYHIVTHYPESIYWRPTV